MYSVKKILDFLSATNEFDIKWCGENEWLQRAVTGINKDLDAGEGDLAWISPKIAGSNPERITAFNGSLLIGPKETIYSKVPLVVCDQPKLAFIRIVNNFFPNLARTSWPKPGENVSADAKIAEDVVLSAGVVIGSGVNIESGVVIGPNTVIANSIINQGVSVGANCTIGLPGFGFEKDNNGRYWRFPHIGRVIIYNNVEIGSNTCIDRGSIGDTVIGRGVKLDNLVHIAHNVNIGDNSMVIANTMVGGSAKIEANAWIAPSVSVMNQVSVGKSAILGMGAVVLKDVEDSVVMVGNPAKLLRKLSKNE